MKNRADISELVQIYEEELYGKLDWWDIHINMMFNEVNEIKDVLYIFNVVKNEWDRRAKENEVTYSFIRTALYESLVYRIILGLSKIYVGSKEFSLLKTINVIEQREELKCEPGIRYVVSQIREYLDGSKMVSAITTYRDKIFAHLDKEAVLSDCRIDVAAAMKDIEMDEIDKSIQLISALYTACFKRRLEYKGSVLSKEDIIYTFLGVDDSKRTCYKGEYMF